MKKLLICAAAFLFTASASMGQKTKPAKTPVKAPVAKTTMKNMSDSFSYAAGINIATNMKEQGIITINSALLAKAIDDVYKDRAKAMTPEIAGQCLQNQMAVYTEAKNAESKKVVDAEKAKGKAFLDANKLRPGVIVLPDGLQYEIIKAGDSSATAIKPAAIDTVVLSYSGKFIDGLEFDNSSKSGGAITYHVNGFVKGWTEILQLMTKGAHWKVYIPSDLGYGDRGYPPTIPPGAALVFDITLEDIKPSVVK